MLEIKEAIYKKLKELTSDKFDDSSNVYEIGIDSLDLVELVTDAEDELEHIVSDDALESIKTVGDIIEVFQKK